MSEDPFAARPIEPLRPVPPAAPTGRGPIILIVTGVVALVLAVAAAVIGGRLFLGVLPVGVLDARGEAGPDVVAEVPLPGPGAVDLRADTTYTVLLRTPAGTTSGTEMVVRAPDGTTVHTRIAVPSISAARGGAQARSIAELTTAEAGSYTITGQDGGSTEGPTASLLIVESTGLAPFMGGLLGTIAGVFGAILLGGLGLGLLIGGLVWRHVRRRSPTATRPPGRTSL